MVNRRRYHARVVSFGYVTLLLTAAALGNRANAEVVTVLNAGFEDTSGGTIFNEFSFRAPIGWGLYDPNNVAGNGAGPSYFVGTLTPGATPNPTQFFTAGAPEGQRVGIAFNFASSGGQGEYGLSQTLAATLQANTRYTLNVDVGNIGSGTSVSGDFFNLSGFPGYRIDLMAGGTVIAQDLNSLSGILPEATFATSTLTFQTGAAHALLNQSLGIRLVNLNTIDSTNVMTQAADLEVDFDNVQLSAVSAVPEPSGLVIVAVAALGLNRIRRRRMSQ